MFRNLAITLEMIKFQHTVFALPFAFLAAMVAAEGIPPGRTIFWIAVAMIAARSAAMAFNRLIDSEIDRRNPRTRLRALPAGQLSRPFVITFTCTAAALFVLASYALNSLAFALSPAALLVILGYSFCKRFTSLSHLVLGLCLAIAPVGAAVAVEAGIDPRMLWLATAVLFWTAGFDILYSLQDIAFDRAAGLFSLPARLGIRRSLTLSRLFHLVAVTSLTLFGMAYGLGWIYYAGVAAAAGLILWQHSLVTPNDLSRIDAAFFTANGLLSVVVFVCGAYDILIRGRAG